MLAILAGIALLSALQIGQDILAPFVAALVLGVIVAPLSDRLVNIGIPRVIIAVTLLVFVVLILGTAALLIEPLVTLVIEELPRLKVIAASWLDSLSGLLRGIEEISKEIEESVGADQKEAATDIPTIEDALWFAPNFIGQVLVFLGTLFFFVLTRDEIYAALGARGSQLREADRAVAKYFAAITVVNFGLGAVTAVVLMAIGVTNAPIWGLAAGVMNYMLYLGPILIIAGLTVAGMLQFSGAEAFLPAAAFLFLNMIEANFATPWVVGKRLSLNPLVIFMAVVGGLWLWGPAGAIVVLPVILWLGVLFKPDLVMSDQTAPRRNFSWSKAKRASLMAQANRSRGRPERNTSP